MLNEQTVRRQFASPLTAQFLIRRSTGPGPRVREDRAVANVAQSVYFRSSLLHVAKV